MSVIRMEDLDLAGKRVLIREDLNAPVHNGRVTSDARLQAALPTLRMALAQNAAVILVSHRGRPKAGAIDPELSMQPVADHLGELLGREIPVQADWLSGVDVAPGQIVMTENVRFLEGERSNDEALARKMAALCDVYVMDAFGTAHRAEASTCGIAEFAPVACAGPLLSGELDALGRAMDNPRRPLVAVVGGAKVSTKLEVLNALVGLADRIIVGGGIANTFIAATGHAVGKSLYEPDLIETARALMDAASQRDAEIPVPSDVVCAKSFSADAEASLKAASEVQEDDLILDVGPETAARYADILAGAGTIVWNGPLGVFEFDAFAHGTEVLAKAIAASDAFSIAGGGDTLAAVQKFEVGNQVSYISTGGGAFLEFLEGKKLPALAALEARAV